jgi:hypothetical protein
VRYEGEAYDYLFFCSLPDLTSSSDSRESDRLNDGESGMVASNLGCAQVLMFFRTCYLS